MNIPLFKIFNDKEDVENISEVIKMGLQWAKGGAISYFENNIKSYIGTKYCVLFNSGTTALSTLITANRLTGDIIVPRLTFKATYNAVRLAGGNPVFAESESETYGLDADSVERVMTPGTEAIILVHYGGYPARDTDKIKRLAGERGLILLEDAAESFGAAIGDKKVGTFGEAAMFSFCQNKIITTGEGGCIVTDSQAIASLARLLSDHGNDKNIIGSNYRMSSITAALGIAQLNKIDKILALRRMIAERYSEELGNLVTTPQSRDYAVYQLYTIATPRRDALKTFLTEKGIETKIYFECGSLISKRILSLPIYPSMTPIEQDYVIGAVKEFLSKQDYSSNGRVRLDRVGNC